MDTDTLENLKYPTGRFAPPENYDTDGRDNFIKDLANLPGQLKQETYGLSEEQINTPYRENGWTVRQLIHHIADSHMNSYARFKLGLTENKPTIKPYDQDAWVNSDDIQLPISVSLDIINGVHQRLVALLNGVTEEGFNRTVVHPEQGKEISIDYLLAMYAWHSKHHLRHITALKERNGW